MWFHCDCSRPGKEYSKSKKKNPSLSSEIICSGVKSMV